MELKDKVVATDGSYWKFRSMKDAEGGEHWEIKLVGRDYEVSV